MSALVSFYKHAVLNQEKSKEAKRKISDEVIYIEIRHSKNSSFSRPMTEEDKYKYPEQWGSFVINNGLDTQSGTPLKILPAINTAQLVDLAEMGIRTIEALLESDEADVIEGADLLKRQAQAYIAACEVSEKPRRKRRTKAEIEAEKEAA